MRYLPRLSMSVWALLALLTGSSIACLAPAFGADQKPLVVNPTTGRTEQLQTGNNLVTPVGSSLKVLDTTAANASNSGPFTVGNGTAATTTAIGSGVLFTGANLGVGTSFTETAAQSPLRVESSLTDTQCGGIMSRITYTPAAGNANQSRALGVTWNVNATAGNLTATASAPNAATRSVATVTAGNVTAMAGYTTLVRNTGTGTVADLHGVNVQTMTNTGGGAVTNAKGVFVDTQNIGTNRFGVDIAAISGGTTNFAIRTQAGLVSFNDTTDASAIGTAAFITTGGASVAKRSFLGTIGSTFKGNVIAGVQDATADTAGAVGEVLSGSASSTAVAATGTVGNVCSVSLTPGAWVITGSFTINQGATGLTTGSVVNCSIVTTTATNGTQGTTMNQDSALLAANGFKFMSAPTVTANISATTTYYLTEQCAFTAGSPTVSGKITAVRIR